jgi:hypothetical protein
VSEKTAPGSTRRTFLVRAGTTAVAATTIAITAPAIADAASDPNGTEATEPDGAGLASSPIVLYIRNSKVGEFALLVGEKEIIYRDPAAMKRVLAEAEA